MDWWNTVIFSNESKFNISGSDGRIQVWRQPKKELEEKNMQATVKHGGGNCMVWGCMSAQGVGELVFIEGKMKYPQYLQILKNNLKKSAENMGILNCFKFYQDNDPKHTSMVTA